jgi:hypothetical protein
MKAWGISLLLLITILHGQTISDFSLKGWDGKMISSNQFKNNKAWVVVFSSHACVFSQKYEGRILSLANTYIPKGVSFMMINANDPSQSEEESSLRIKKYGEEKKYPFLYLPDETQQIANILGATRNPEVFILVGNQIVYHGAIDNNPLLPENVTERYVENVLTEILSGKSVSFTEKPVNGCMIKRK